MFIDFQIIASLEYELLIATTPPQPRQMLLVRARPHPACVSME